MPSASASAASVGTPKRAEQIDHEPVADPHPVSQSMALVGQEHTAIRTRGGETGALEPRNRLYCRGMRYAKPPGDVGRARFAGAHQQIGDQFDVIFQQSRRLRRPRLAKAAGLGAFGRKLLGGITMPALCRFTPSPASSVCPGSRLPAPHATPHFYIRVKV